MSDVALREAVLASLQRWRDDPAATRSAVAASAGEWLQQLGELAAAREAPVALAAEAARAPWWR